MTKNEKISEAMRGNENGRHCRKYTVNVNAFDRIETQEQAYWLGFIAADGWVSAGASYNFGLKLAIKDLSHLKRFRDFINSRHKVGITQSRCNKGNNTYCVLQVSSKDFVTHLLRVGITPRKSANLEFPEFLEASLLRHYIRGVFDGDGWTTFNRRTGISFGIVGRESFLLRIMNELVGNCDLKPVSLRKDKRHCNQDTVYLVYGGNLQCRRIYDYLYKDASVYLERKERGWHRA